MIYAIAAALVTAALLYTLLFEDWEEFAECVKFYLTPDIISLFRGKFWEDYLGGNQTRAVDGHGQRQRHHVLRHRACSYVHHLLDDARRRVFAGVVCANPARQAQPIVAENPAARARPVAVPLLLCLSLSYALASQKPASFVFR